MLQISTNAAKCVYSHCRSCPYSRERAVQRLLDWRCTAIALLAELPPNVPRIVEGGAAPALLDGLRAYPDAVGVQEVNGIGYSKL